MAYLERYSWRRLLPSVVIASALAVSGCSKDGSDGATGPVGPSGPNIIVKSDIPDIAIATITSASVAADGALAVEFSITDDQGNGFVGLSDVRFTVAKLAPAGFGGDGSPSRWASYINKTETPKAGVGPATAPQTQATYERCKLANGLCDNGKGVVTGATLVDNGDGSYSYIFAIKLDSDYKADWTHRIGLQAAGGLPATNATYDWLPSTGSTNVVSRNIVAEETCNSCHGELALHGSRVDTSYCVTCHNPGSTDANSGHTVDFKVMVHKIHRGTNLNAVQPSKDAWIAAKDAKDALVAPTPNDLDAADVVIAAAKVSYDQAYAIWGYRDTMHSYSEVEFPQDLRSCTTCHNEPAGVELTQVDNWKTQPSMDACGSCHDDVYFGEAPVPAGKVAHFQPQADDSGCLVCHAENSGNGDVVVVHETYQANATSARDQLVIDIVSAELTSTGTGPAPGNNLDVVLNISINGSPVNDYAADVMPKVDNSDGGYLLLNWDNGDGYQFKYSSPEGGYSPATNNFKLSSCTGGAGVFTCSWETTIGGGEGDVVVTVVGLPLCANEKSATAELINCTTPQSASEKVGIVAITPPKKYFALTGSDGPLVESTSYTEKLAADVASCNSCHKDLNAHSSSNAAKEFSQCKSCHNATKIAWYPGRPGDLKSHVHSFHASNDSVNTDKNLGEAFGDNYYPGDISNCNACHSVGQFDLPLQQNTRPSKSSDGSAGIVYTSPTAVVCSSCHIAVPVGYIVGGDINGAAQLNGNEPEGIELTDSEIHWLNHMMQKGAVFGVDNVDVATGTESCATCHAIGKENGVDAVHNLR